MERHETAGHGTGTDPLDGWSGPPRVGEPAVIVYSLPGCVHCQRARGILRRRGVAYEERSGAGVAGFRAWLAANAAGATVPQIVIRGAAVGGADRLAALDRSGALVPLIEGSTFPLAVVRRHRSVVGASRWLIGRGSAWRYTVDTIDGSGRLLARATAASAAEAAALSATQNAAPGQAPPV